jgi:hypothetical protein
MEEDINNIHWSGLPKQTVKIYAPNKVLLLSVTTNLLAAHTFPVSSDGVRVAWEGSL